MTDGDYALMRAKLRAKTAIEDLHLYIGKIWLLARQGSEEADFSLMDIGDQLCGLGRATRQAAFRVDAGGED